MNPDLARCDREIASIADHPYIDRPGSAIDSTMGHLDWEREKRMIEAEEYERFLQAKAQDQTYAGFDPLWMPSFPYDFQLSQIDWTLRKGKSLLAADCGMGKTIVELVWAENVVRKTNKPVLILTPLAVAKQMIGEAEKFGMEARRCHDGRAQPGINITNYEKLHHFDPADWGGCVCDESSAIKAFDGKRRAQVTEFLRTLPYRLLATATAAPNDYIELGTASEALGVMGQMDMLNRFFKNDQNTSDMRRIVRHSPSQGGPSSAGWRFKGHAEIPYWRWCCSWMRAGRKPSDFGPFDDARFVLPELIEREHIVETRTLGDGMLFAMPATNMREERDERRRTIQERCEKAAELVADTGKPFVIWCGLNDEGKLLAKLLGEKHVHPLQLDVIERVVTLWSNPGEKVFTPCMGVGSEVYGAVRNDRLGIGVELKPSYYRQAVKNVALALLPREDDEQMMFAEFSKRAGSWPGVAVDENGNEIPDEPLEVLES